VRKGKEDTVMKCVRMLAVFLVIAFIAGALVAPVPAGAATAGEIDRDATKVLKKLYAKSPSARALGEKAKGILVFPSITKGGFMVGGQYGEGALRKDGKTVGYYSSVAMSYGLQAGVQTFGYALFFMTDSALKWLDRSDGWEIGTGPSIVLVDEGTAGTFTTTTAQSDIFAFIFSQKGLMAGIGLQGTKITKVKK
jgi:lipid-binding SYLF domain-containing protein